MSKNIIPDIDFFRTLSIEAGDIMRRFHGNAEYELKSDNTPVTLADRMVNELVIRRMEAAFPHISVIAEEGSRFIPEAEYCIFCDPIDGTESYRTGGDLVAFSIALVRRGRPIAAVIHNPFRRKTWTAVKGHGCFMNGVPVTVSVRDSMSISGFYVAWWPGTEKMVPIYEELGRLGGKMQHRGSIVFPGGLVASGDLEATIFPGNKSWEAATMDLIVTEAGGTFSDLFGKPITYPNREGGGMEGSGHIASNGILHTDLLEVIGSHL